MTNNGNVASVATTAGTITIGSGIVNGTAYYNQGGTSSVVSGSIGNITGGIQQAPQALDAGNFPVETDPYPVSASPPAVPSGTSAASPSPPGEYGTLNCDMFLTVGRGGAS